MLLCLQRSVLLGVGVPCLVASRVTTAASDSGRFLPGSLSLTCVSGASAQSTGARVVSGFHSLGQASLRGRPQWLPLAGVHLSVSLRGRGQYKVCARSSRLRQLHFRFPEVVVHWLRTDHGPLRFELRFTSAVVRDSCFQFRPEVRGSPASAQAAVTSGSSFDLRQQSSATAASGSGRK